jgi:2-polyprenyl-6-hydroxyphenyl methylase/3-demethylubiquinone-9 3-methyltransferase
MTAPASSKALHSGAYVDMYERKPLSRLERLLPLMDLRDDQVLADFACGNAMLWEIVHGKVAEYHGVDFSEDFIDAARRREGRIGAPGCNLYCDDIIAFCAANPARFDVATALDFSEHVGDQEFVAIFSAIHASLKPGGRLFLHTPNLSFFLERLKDWGVTPQFPEHIAVRTAGANRELLQRSGFRSDQISVRMIPHYNVLKLLHPLRQLPIVGGWFEARQFITCLK